MTISDAIFPFRQLALLQVEAVISRILELYAGPTDSDYPACGTAYKAVGRREITAFDCANNELEVSLYISTDFSTSQSDEDIPSTASTTAISSIETTGSKGVIGGLALIALIGVVLWFLRRKKHIPSHSDSNLHSTANYHPQPQALPDEVYTNPTYNAPPYDHPPMSSAPRNVSQNFSTLHYAASPQTSEFPSTPGRPKTPELG
ncbi:uncharacterized protein FTOL_10572 [Fusarium torulosum]|uniref:Uncharacterized protein n=1 Tax=Fusarium torulosum TaxID=33205 RepID=A0AAE8SMF8_9HYPO|nr:uncharacterized protein FTOL_10572 [Fusarium torulosum]